MNAVTKQEPMQIVAHDDAPMVAMIERIAMDPSIPIDRLEKMLAMKESMDDKAAARAFAAAFAAASSEFPNIPMNGEGNNKKPYATLKDIISHTRPVLSKHGLALSFLIDTTAKNVIVTAELQHVAGHSKKTSIDLPNDTSGSKNAVQAVGSSQTYGQRYTAQAILGLSLGEDTEDDGKASGPVQQEAPKQQYSWAGTVIQDLPEDATPRDKAEAITNALCAQFRRMKGLRQISNEWDRRADLIGSLEDKYSDLHLKVIDAYELQVMDIKERA